MKRPVRLAVTLFTALSIFACSGPLQAFDGLSVLPSIGHGAAVFGNEAVAQLTTNPPSPELSTPDASRDQRYETMKWYQRLAATNKDAVQSIGRSLKAFFKDPIKNLGPVLKSGASSSIQPFTHPGESLRMVKDYYHQKGFVDGTATAAYMLSNVVSVVAICVGLASVGAMICGVSGAAAVGGVALAVLGFSSILGFASNGAQLVNDEAQSAAPEAGVKFPSWVPLVGGKSLFRPTSHSEQVDLLKFDLLNTGGSVVTVGFSKLGGSVAYAGLTATEVGIMAGAAPAADANGSPALAAPAAPTTDLSALRAAVGHDFQAVTQAAASGNADRVRSARAAYQLTRQAYDQARSTASR